MKPESQIAILKTIVRWQAEEIETLEKALQERDEWLGAITRDWDWPDDDTLTGSIDGLDDVTLRVQIQTPEEHAWVKRQRWERATQTPVPKWTTGGKNGSKAAT